MLNVIVCETTAAIVPHLRLVGSVPKKLGGHYEPKPVALCGVTIAWDTNLPLAAARCRACLSMLRALEQDTFDVT